MSVRPAGAAPARAPFHLPLVLLAALAAAACAPEGRDPPPALGPEARPAPVAGPARLDLSDFGARGDGAADDAPALQRALEALKAAGGGTLHVPAGRHRIASPVRVDFAGLEATVEIAGVPSATTVAPPDAGGAALSRGLDLTSELRPQTGPRGVAIVLAGARRVVLRDLAFVGTAGVNSDALVTVTFTGIAEARIEHCEFYGVGSLEGGAIVFAEGSGLSVERSAFLGVTTSSGLYSPVIENVGWRHVSVTDSVFVDYGTRPELYGKTPLAPPHAWIGVGDAAAALPDSPRREVIVRDVFFDEGALAAVSIRPARYGRPPSAGVDLFYATGVRMNVSNLRTSGFYVEQTEGVLVEDSHYGWSKRAHAGINLVGVREAILSRVSCEPQIPCLLRSPSTGRTWVIASTGPGLEASGAEVVPVRDERDDVVLHVRREFARLAGREPDPASHFYWSRRILRCGGDARCVAERRRELASHLSRGAAGGAHP